MAVYLQLASGGEYAIPDPVQGAALRAYFNEHVRLAVFDDLPRWLRDAITRPGEEEGKAERFLTDQYVVTKPLHAFKLAWTKRKKQSPQPHHVAIVNLVIPVGAAVHASGDAFHFIGDMPKVSLCGRKMRCSEAIVHSVFDRLGEEIDEACSHFNLSFSYRKGVVVKPASQYLWEPKRCAEGIHFFLNVRDAYDYNWT